MDQKFFRLNGNVSQNFVRQMFIVCYIFESTQSYNYFNPWHLQICWIFLDLLPLNWAWCCCQYLAHIITELLMLNAILYQHFVRQMFIIFYVLYSTRSYHHFKSQWWPPQPAENPKSRPSSATHHNVEHHIPAENISM